jgi:hypothetical protein
MAKMDDDTLLSHLQKEEEAAADYVWGALSAERLKAMREYHREPYGNEEEGWSTIVTSEVQDTIEWLLPDLLDVFVSTDKAVVFEPTRAQDVAGAEQATDACNYVFYKQNNGFLVLYTALKDALMVKNCAVMWRKEEKRTKSVLPVQNATPEMLAMVLAQHEEAEIESASEVQQPIMDQMTGQPAVDPLTGQPMVQTLINARISYIEKRKTIKIEAFPPENLLVRRDWTQPLLDDCPYVARAMEVSLSDLHEMGFEDVTAEDLTSSGEPAPTDEDAYRAERAGRNGDAYIESRQRNDVEDDSLKTGILRIEFVLVDYDGDGIAERRCIYRLQNKVLSNDECSHVQIATASPVLLTHRWDGLSVADLMSDLQRLNTELTRQVLNSAYLSNNPRKTVLTDVNGTPRANIDDLLDSRPGGILRQQQVDAIGQDITPFVGGQMLPLLEYVDQMGERRTGLSRQSQGLDPNAINERTATAARMAQGAGQKRIKLMARIFAEILLKPMFRGTFKLLTDGDMERIAFKLRDQFVEYDPNEWRDSYDTTINVGLGTGDKEVQGMQLQQIAAAQGALAASPFGPLLLKPKQVYNTQAKLVENAGFKNVGDFFIDPGDQPLPPPPPMPPDPKIAVKQMELQADAQKFQAETQRLNEVEQLKAQAKLQEVRANLELQAANDARDSEREMMKAQFEAQQAMRDDETKRLIAQLDAEITRYKTDADNAVKLQIAGMQQQTAVHANETRAQQAQEKSEPQGD